MALPAARLLAATRTLAALPPADIHLWTDGSLSANGDGGAGYAIFVHGTLRVADASPTGQGVSELRAEAIACLAGLQTVLSLQDYSACQGISVLTDSKSLVQRWPQGPARQTFGSIWTVLPTIGISNAVNVQWIPAHVGLQAIQQQTKKPSEGPRCHSQPYLWTFHLLPRLLNGINRASLRICTSASHMPGSTEFLQAANTVTSLATV